MYLHVATTRSTHTDRRDRAEQLSGRPAGEQGELVMAEIRLSAHVDAPIDRVFELATDFKRYPEWNVAFVEVADVLGPPDKVGTRITATMTLLDRKMQGWAEIEVFNRPRFVKLEGVSTDGGKICMEYLFKRIGLTTDIEFYSNYELPPGPFAGILDWVYVNRAAERDLRHSMENLKALVEAETPVLA